MNKRNKLVAIVAAVLATIFLLTTILPFLLDAVYAAPDTKKAAELQKKLETAKKEKENNKAAIQKIKQEKGGLLAEKNKLDEQIRLVEDEMSDADAQLAAIDGRIGLKQQELDEASAALEAQTEDFKTRARVMYQNGAGTYLEVLLGAEDFSDFVSRVDLVQRITKVDKELVDTMSANKKKIEDAKAVIVQERTNQEIYKQTVQVRQDQLAEQLDARNEIITALESDQSEYEKALAQNEKEQDKIQSEIKRALEQSEKGSGALKSFASGKFIWPSKASRVTSKFGGRKHPVTGRKSNHTGVDIGAAYGTSVLAAADGVVVTAGYSRVYGRYLVVNHGGGFATMYAHNSSLLVKQGQSVKQGNVIAKVGATGLVTGAHIHFEIHKNGTPVNPMGYF